MSVRILPFIFFRGYHLEYSCAAFFYIMHFQDSFVGVQFAGFFCSLSEIVNMIYPFSVSGLNFDIPLKIVSL